MTDPTHAGLVALDWVGAALWAVGATFEAVGDTRSRD
jgi:steroid 5-alpha reductase family enzyme